MFIFIFLIKIFVCCIYWRPYYSKQFLAWASLLIAHIQLRIQIIWIFCHQKIQSYIKLFIKLFSAFFDTIWFLTFWGIDCSKSLSRQASGNFSRVNCVLKAELVVIFWVDWPFKISKSIFLNFFLLVLFNLSSIGKERIILYRRICISI